MSNIIRRVQSIESPFLRDCIEGIPGVLSMSLDFSRWIHVRTEKGITAFPIDGLAVEEIKLEVKGRMSLTGRKLQVRRDN